MVHEQFFTDTTDYADVVLPATTFLEHKDVMGRMGISFAQITSRRSRRWVRRGRMCGCLVSWRGGWDLRRSVLRMTEEELIEQALETEHPWFAGIRGSGWSAKGRWRWRCPRTRRRGAAVLDAGVVQDGERAGGVDAGAGVCGAGGVARWQGGRGSVSAGVSAAEGGQLYEHDVREYSAASADGGARRRDCWRCMRTDAAARGVATGDAWRCSTRRGRITAARRRWGRRCRREWWRRG